MGDNNHTRALFAYLFYVSVYVLPCFRGDVLRLSSGVFVVYFEDDDISREYREGGRQVLLSRAGLESIAETRRPNRSLFGM